MQGAGGRIGVALGADISEDNGGTCNDFLMLSLSLSIAAHPEMVTVLHFEYHSSTPSCDTSATQLTPAHFSSACPKT